MGWRRSLKKILVVFAIGTLCALVFGVYRQYSRVQILRASTSLREQARQQLAIDMTRDEVVQIVAPTSWRRYKCPYYNNLGSNEYYLYGSYDLNLGSILHLKYDGDGGKARLVSIYGAETYMLEYLVAGCTQETFR